MKFCYLIVLFYCLTCSQRGGVYYSDSFNGSTVQALSSLLQLTSGAQGKSGESPETLESEFQRLGKIDDDYEDTVDGDSGNRQALYTLGELLELKETMRGPFIELELMHNELTEHAIDQACISAFSLILELCNDKPLKGNSFCGVLKKIFKRLKKAQKHYSDGLSRFTHMKGRALSSVFALNSLIRSYSASNRMIRPTVKEAMLTLEEASKFMENMSGFVKYITSTYENYCSVSAHVYLTNKVTQQYGM